MYVTNVWRCVKRNASDTEECRATVVLVDGFCFLTSSFLSPCGGSPRNHVYRDLG